MNISSVVNSVGSSNYSLTRGRANRNIKYSSIEVPEQVSSSFKKSFSVGKLVKTVGLAVMLATAALVTTGCKKNEPVAVPEEPTNQEPVYSPEELEFCEAAYKRLESDHALVQSCNQYMCDNLLFDSACDLVNNNYPDDWCIQVIMMCLRGNQDMRDWFSEVTGIPSYKRG